MSDHTAARHFPCDHPTGPGHFPGNPIIPGAVLLDAVLDAVQSTAGAGALPASGTWTIQSAKFMHPVRPGDAIDIHWTTRPDTPIRFECRLLGRTVVTGSLRLNGS